MRTRIGATAPAPIAVIALLLSLPAFAQDYGRDGFYGGFDLLGGHYTDEPSNVDLDTTFAFDLYAGYRLHPNFALEGEFEMLTDTDVEVDGFGKVTELETWTLTANSKFFFTTDRVQPYVKFGMGLMEGELDDDFPGVDEDETAFTVRLGGGLDYYATENIVVTGGLDYLIPTGDLDDFDYLTFGAGVQYRF